MFNTAIWEGAGTRSTSDEVSSDGLPKRLSGAVGCHASVRQDQQQQSDVTLLLRGQQGDPGPFGLAQGASSRPGGTPARGAGNLQQCSRACKRKQAATTGGQVCRPAGLSSPVYIDCLDQSTSPRFLSELSHSCVMYGAVIRLSHCVMHSPRGSEGENPLPSAIRISFSQSLFCKAPLSEFGSA